VRHEVVVRGDTLASIVDEFDDGERLIGGPVLRDQEVEPVSDARLGR
jgi:hypothetical protein